MFVWEPHQFNASTLADSTSTAKIASAVPETTDELNPAERELNAVYKRKLKCLRTLGDVAAMSSDSIAELYKRLHELLIALPGTYCNILQY